MKEFVAENNDLAVTLLLQKSSDRVSFRVHFCDSFLFACFVVLTSVEISSIHG